MTHRAYPSAVLRTRLYCTSVPYPCKTKCTADRAGESECVCRSRSRGRGTGTNNRETQIFLRSTLR